MAWNWSNAGQGALEYGSIGASLGSLAGPKGAAIGGGIGSIFGAIQGGFFTDDEAEEITEAYKQGKLDAATIGQIESTIARRYNMLRRSQSHDLARRGFTNSSFAARQIGDTYNAERDALAQALTFGAAQRQQYGLQRENMLNAQRSQNAQNAIGAVFQGLGAYQQGQALASENARNDLLATRIGQFYETNTPQQQRNSPFIGPTSPTAGNSQSGAGNAVSRHRSRMPNVRNPFLQQSGNSPFLKQSGNSPFLQ